MRGGFKYPFIVGLYSHPSKNRCLKNVTIFGVLFLNRYTYWFGSKISLSAKSCLQLQIVNIEILFSSIL